MRDKIKFLNLKAISKELNISYNILANYSSGRKQDLTEEQKQAIKEFVRNLF